MNSGSCKHVRYKLRYVTGREDGNIEKYVNELVVFGFYYLMLFNIINC